MATSEPTGGRVDVVHLADGKLVRLTGMTGPDEVAGLRLALLDPLARGCCDVVVDAGEVTAVSDEALEVLMAAPSYVAAQGGRFLLSRSSIELDIRLAERQVELPRLTPLAPAQRSAPPSDAALVRVQRVRAPRCCAQRGPARRPRPAHPSPRALRH